MSIVMKMENKYQEALDRLLNDEYDFPHDFYEDDKATAMERDIDTLQELVDKATPKKIRYENAPKPSMAYMYSCPNCGRMLGVNCKPTYINYCDVCGIKFDWSDK